MEAAHLALFDDGEAWWLAHLHLFLEVAVEESGLNVLVVESPSLLNSQREEYLLVPGIPAQVSSKLTSTPTHSLTMARGRRRG